MAEQDQNAATNFEARLASLESKVAHLASLLQPALALNGIALPVAAPALKESAQHEFNAKFFALLDMGEALLKYSATMAFALLHERSHPQALAIEELFKSAPSLGKWVAELRRVLDDAVSTEWPISIVRAAFRKPNDKQTSTARYLFEDFISIRNEERGHGAQQPEGYYEGLYLKNRLVLQDCVRACKQLEISLVHIHAVDHLRDKSAYKATLLMGATPRSLTEPIVTPVKVTVGSTCLWDNKERLLPMAEFMSYRYCPTCNLEHVFFAEKFTAEKVSYHSYVGNHRTVVDRPGT